MSWKMNPEKYKKFLDGLGALKGISHPVRRGGELSRSSEGSGRVRPSAIDRGWRRMEHSGDVEESAASPGGSREGWCFPWLRFTSLFCLVLGCGAVCLGTKRWGSG